MVKKVELLDSELHKIVAEAPDLAASTRNKYLRDLNAWIEFAGTDPSAWTTERAQAFYSHLIKTLKPQSANRLMASITYAAKWWAHYKRRPDLDFSQIRKSKASGKARREHLDPTDAMRLLKTCDQTPNGRRDFALMVLGLETGMRRMSLAAVDIEQITTRPYLRVNVPMKGHGTDLISVPLSDAAFVAIELWLSWLGARKGPLFRPLTRKLGRNGFEWVCDRTKSAPAISESTIYKMVKARGETIGLDLHPHLFRHTFVTWRMEAGYGPHEIAAVTGHALNIGALGNYVDMQAIGENMRASTPAWLVELVQERARS